MKKLIAILLIMAAGCMSLSACSGSVSGGGQTGDGGEETTEVTIIEDPDYCYPDSIYSMDEPMELILHEGGFEIALRIYEDYQLPPAMIINDTVDYAVTYYHP